MKFFSLFKARDNLGRTPAQDPISAVRASRWTGPVKMVNYSHEVEAEASLVHPILSRCINKIAGAVASSHWLVIKKNRPADAQRINIRSNERALINVLSNPNNTMTPYDLRYWMALNYATYGMFPFVVGKSSSNTVNAIYPLPTEKTSLVYDNRGRLIRYEVEVAGSGGKLVYKPRSLVDVGDQPSSVPWASHLARPGINPVLDYRTANSPLKSMGLPAQLVDTLLRRAIDTATGHANSRLIVSTEIPIGEKEEKEIRDAINKAPGTESSGHITFVSGAKVHIQELDQDLSDIHSKLPMDDMARQIAGAYGIPISLIGLGAADAAKFANNFVESRRAFWEDTIIPLYLVPIENALTSALCDDEYEIRFDRDSLDAILDSRIDRASKLESVKFLTQNEKRAMVGYAPLSEELTESKNDE